MSLRRTEIPELKKKQKMIYDWMSPQGKRSMVTLSSTMDEYAIKLNELEYINQ